MEWEKAWDLTTRTFAYTNHTLLPEALEKWDVPLMERLLPRLLEIIYEINFHFMSKVNIYCQGDFGKMSWMSIIEEGDPKKIRMGNLAVVGSHSVNGVAALHSQLIKEELFPDFYAMTPEKFKNVTNGVTPRRWVKQANPELAKLITSVVGEDWPKDLNKLQGIAKMADDEAFLQKWMDIKLENKKRLASYLKFKFNFDVDPNTMFDVQIKRIHEYKRQLLNILGTIARYLRIKRDPNGNHVPRTVMIAGKAAPGYDMAKRIIKLVNDVGSVVNNDPETSHLLKIFFLPNYRVSFAERIFPASDLSEQISTAGKEASGTGNMKFALNGALTIGTLDGANIEIKDCVGDENIFIFGLNAHEVQMKRASDYNPKDYYSSNPELRQVLDMIDNGFFSPDARNRFKPIVNALLENGDTFMNLADFAGYLECQERVDHCYRHPEEWHRKGVLNVANMGHFSSDRSVREYAENIWNIPLGNK
jgi:starch phosphorylase